jgi:hypothetical protein
MSLLSDTRGTPNTVWALIHLLSTNAGELQQEGVSGWLDPLDTRIDEHGKTKKGNTFDQTLGAAASLGLIENDRNSKTIKLLVSDLPSDIQGFSDWVHEHLATIPLEDSDSVVLEAFAWFVASCAKEKGTDWIKSLSREQLADNINAALLSDRKIADEENRFNTTKLPRWRDWVGFMGLSIEMPSTGRPTFYPYVTGRFEREVKQLSEKLGHDEEITAATFLAALSERMPYVDGGAHFNLAAKRIGLKPTPRQLSIVLSNSLRELHDEGVLELKTRGDARDVYTLSKDQTHRIESFLTVTIKSPEAPHE